MKKIVALIMALALILTSTAAFAACGHIVGGSYNPQTGKWTPSVPNTHNMIADTLYGVSTWVPTYKNWVANLEDGTHSCDGKTVACDFEYFTLDGVAMYVCPVCGNLNGETVVPEVKSSYLQVNRVDTTAPVLTCQSPCGGAHYEWLTTGKYIVRMMAMPEDSEAAAIITACHEIAGVRYPAECLYNYIVPVDGRNMTLKQAYFGGLKNFDGSINAGVNGLQIRPSKCSSSFGAYLLMK